MCCSSGWCSTARIRSDKAASTAAISAPCCGSAAGSTKGLTTSRTSASMTVGSCGLGRSAIGLPSRRDRSSSEASAAGAALLARSPACVAETLIWPPARSSAAAVAKVAGWLRRWRRPATAFRAMFPMRLSTASWASRRWARSARASCIATAPGAVSAWIFRCSRPWRAS
ncbi:hypothetical protein GALL_548950 [mine drainage metagenome]|uniref:Uncharacterized protein n=1 Tax=mine drainage metagenome TaxID=410659 RepID=A0A1J5PJ23_9ZZZZ